MALKGIEFTSNGTFTVPASVTSLWITAIGGGGGGGPSDGTSGGPAAGGGAGEFTGRRPIKVTPGDVLSVTIGNGGSGGLIGDSHGGNAFPTIFTSGFYSISCQGGFGGAGNNSGTSQLQPPSCDGGGTGGKWLGAQRGVSEQDGYPGESESNCFFGGSTGGGSQQTLGMGGQLGGGWGPWSGGPGGAGATVGDFKAQGGGGGASSVYGIGAVGCAAYALVPPGPTAPNAVYWGTAGGGAGGWCTDKVGGIGAKGYLLVQWCG